MKRRKGKKGPYEDCAALIKEWLEEEGTYDEEIWPSIQSYISNGSISFFPSPPIFSSLFWYRVYGKYALWEETQRFLYFLLNKA
jgi:hypothetical protein